MTRGDLSCATSLANRIRALEPTSGEYALVPRSALSTLMEDIGPCEEGWHDEHLTEAVKKIKAAMLNAATSNGSGK